MKTSAPPRYKVESAPTVVEISKSNANEEPLIVSVTSKGELEPKFCCFKAKNYISFSLICQILVVIGLTIYACITFEQAMPTSIKILPFMHIAITALGLMGILQKNFAVFSGFIGLNTINIIYTIIVLVFQYDPKNSSSLSTSSISFDYDDIGTAIDMDWDLIDRRIDFEFESFMKIMEMKYDVSTSPVDNGISDLDWEKFKVRRSSDDFNTSPVDSQVDLPNFLICGLIAYVLSSIFLIYLPAIKHAWFLRKRGKNQTNQK